MGGITPFSRSQYETIARSSIDEYWKMGSSRQRRTTSEQQHGVVVGSPELSYDKCWRNTNTALKIVPKDDASLARRCSASEVPSSADNKQNRRFVSNKVLLELRSNFKSGNRSASTSVGCGDVVNASAMSKLSNKSSSTLCRAFSVRAENAIQPSGLPSGHKSLEVDKEQSETQLEMSPCSPTVDSVLHNFGKLCPVDLTKSPLLTSSSIQAVTSTCTKPCFLLEKQMQAYGDTPSLTQTRPAQQPTKTVLQLQNRASRTNSIDISSKVDLNENHLPSERPAYARRFMQNRSETIAPLLSRPSIDDGLTPLFNANEKLKEPAHFVLPPLPLGLRPPSPEPRNLLLNAPKKRRVSSSSAFDLSCLSRMLRPYQSKSHSQKRPVCRVLRFGD